MTAGLNSSAAEHLLLRGVCTDMAKTCDVCGNDYYLTFDVVRDGKTYTFDSFECAIHKLAPTCDHCGCRIIGHGIEADGTFYCCAHCARASGVTAVADHA